MPRTTAVECPGCPPLRALITDVLGLVKVVEVCGKVGIPKVVETWGSPDASRSVLAASFADHETQPLLAVARKNSLVEFLNPLNGVVMATINVGESGSLSHAPEDDPVVGLHLLKTKTTNLSSRLSMFLMCTSKGKVSLRSIELANASDSIKTDSLSTWDVSKAGKVICSSVDARENYALFGGKGIEVNVWDLDKGTKIWTSKPPPSNSLSIFSPTWFNAATFLNKEDQRKIAVGTNDYQLRLYDISAQRRPVVSVNFRESPIKVVTADLDGYTIYVGNGSGDLASFDMRTGKLLGCFVGKCCGSIRSIARHPELPLLASCGLDSYLRLWDIGTRQLLSAVFLKQHLTNVVIDSHFSYEEPTDNEVVPPSDLKVTEQTEVEDDKEFQLASRSKKSRKHEKSKIKIKETQKEVEDDDQTKEVQAHAFFQGEDRDANELPVLKRRKPSSQVKDDRRHKVKKGEMRSWAELGMTKSLKI